VWSQKPDETTQEGHERMSDTRQVYDYTYLQPDFPHPFTTKVRIFERSEQGGWITLILETVGESWPHRPNDIGLMRSVVLTLDEAHEYFHYQLVPEDGMSNS